MPVTSVALKQSISSSSADTTLHPIGVRLLLQLVLVVLISALNVVAQEPPEGEVVRVSTDLSVFPVRITDNKRRAVAGVTAADFQMKDPDRITTSFYFGGAADHVALVFALDQSGSLRETLSQQRDAAVGLFEHFKKASRVAVIRFSNVPRIVVPFGEDSEAARAAFTFSPARDSHTAIFDAANSAVQSFEDSFRNPTERRIVILISDGLDNASATRPAQVIADAQAKNVSFYMIQIPLFEPRDGRLVVRGPSKGFRELAEKTGGKYFLVGDSTSALKPANIPDLSPIFSAIEEDLKSQYVLGFYVAESARDGRAHRVSIRLTRPGLVYSVAQYGYDQSHHFSVKLAPHPTTKSPELK